MVTAPTKTWLIVSSTLLIPMNESRLVVGKMFSIVRSFEPANTSPTFCRTKLMPMAVIRGASFGARRSGL